MGAEQHFTESNGVLVTDNGIPPPVNWTNVLDDMGGPQMWFEGGQIEDEVRGRGLEGDIRPHYGIAPYTGEETYLFEVGSGQFFLFNNMDGSLLQITDQSDLESIVSVLNDESQGLGAFELEQL